MVFCLGCSKSEDPTPATPSPTPTPSTPVVCVLTESLAGLHRLEYTWTNDKISKVVQNKLSTTNDVVIYAYDYSALSIFVSYTEEGPIGNIGGPVPRKSILRTSDGSPAGILKFRDGAASPLVGDEVRRYNYEGGKLKYFVDTPDGDPANSQDSTVVTWDAANNNIVKTERYSKSGSSPYTLARITNYTHDIGTNPFHQQVRFDDVSIEYFNKNNITLIRVPSVSASSYVWNYNDNGTARVKTNPSDVSDSETFVWKCE